MTNECILFTTNHKLHMELRTIDFAEGDGFVPAVVHDAHSRVVLMLGYMNAEAVEVVIEA